MQSVTEKIARLIYSAGTRLVMAQKVSVLLFFPFSLLTLRGLQFELLAQIFPRFGKQHSHSGFMYTKWPGAI